MGGVRAMEREDFERVYEAFLEFHAFFAGALDRPSYSCVCTE